MSEAVESVAKALIGLDGCSDEYKRKAGRSAIAAMRDSATPEMIKKGQQAIDECKSSAYVWRLMNEVALK